MKRFEWIKTIQLLIYFILTVAALMTIFRDAALYQIIASNPHVKFICGILWLMMGLSFVFMFFDFSSYTDLKRENLELDQAIYSDMLTGVANRYSCDAYIAQYMNRAMPPQMGCVTLDLVNLKEINDRLGHRAGDDAIREFSDILTEAARAAEVILAEIREDGKVSGADSGDLGGAGASNCFIGRNGGNKFLAIFRICSGDIMSGFLSEVERLEENREAMGGVRIVYAVGTAYDEGEKLTRLVDLVALSDWRAAKDKVRERAASGFLPVSDRTEEQVRVSSESGPDGEDVSQCGRGENSSEQA